ncbi:hypothetical protein F8388_009528 [Cannabis sativa]|uniref:Uncharacterized protein n=1 Tax=Cannabis sativa TaxID=3483 RepID=A0A7J6H749_CANSA|nr:hypothetical protein F8388_009528 [Cannabis sativa]
MLSLISQARFIDDPTEIHKGVAVSDDIDATSVPSVPTEHKFTETATSSGTTTTTTTITTDANLIDGRGWGSTGAATTPSRYKNQKRRRLPAPARSARPGTASMPSSVASAQPTKSTVVDRKLTRSVHTPSDFTCVRLGIFRPKPAREVSLG